MTYREPNGLNFIKSAIGPAEFMQFGKKQTDALLNVQKELLQAYEDASRAWAVRVKSKVEFWSDVAQKMAKSGTVPEGFATYSQSISQRMQILADDGRRMFEDAQKLIAAVARSVNGEVKKDK